MRETGPMIFRPYPRRLECLTICRCKYKGSTFSSVILRPWVFLSRTLSVGLEPSTSRTVVRRSTNWAYVLMLIVLVLYLSHKCEPGFSVSFSRYNSNTGTNTFPVDISKWVVRHMFWCILQACIKTNVDLPHVHLMSFRETYSYNWAKRDARFMNEIKR